MCENVSVYKVKKCLLCGEETDSNDNEEFFCSACGSPLINACSNYNCQRPLNSKAAHCKYCGSNSVFLNAGLVESKKTLNDDELPF